MYVYMESVMFIDTSVSVIYGIFSSVSGPIYGNIANPIVLFMLWICMFVGTAQLKVHFMFDVYCA